MKIEVENYHHLTSVDMKFFHEIFLLCANAIKGGDLKCPELLCVWVCTCIMCVVINV